MVNYYIFHDRQIARFNIEYFKPKWGGVTLISVIAYRFDRQLHVHMRIRSMR